MIEFEEKLSFLKILFRKQTSASVDQRAIDQTLKANSAWQIVKGKPAWPHNSCNYWLIEIIIMQGMGITFGAINTVKG